MLFHFFNFIPTQALSNLALVGALTALFSRIRAFTEIDFKKIIALSTLSQLGLIVFSLGLNLPNLTLFHLLTHALFKALLFLCVGLFIHSNDGIQDLRLTSINPHPMVLRVTAISLLSLRGIPFLSGFYSKDLIIELMLGQEFNVTLRAIIVTRVGLTFSYSFRIFKTILSPVQSPLSPSQEIDSNIKTPLTSLSLGHSRRKRAKVVYP